MIFTENPYHQKWKNVCNEIRKIASSQAKSEGSVIYSNVLLFNDTEVNSLFMVVYLGENHILWT